MEIFDELSEHFRLALGHDIDRTVRLVLGITGDTELGRRVLDKSAVPDPLDFPRHNAVCFYHMYVHQYTDQFEILIIFQKQVVYPHVRAISSVGRAAHLHCEGREFEPLIAHKSAGHNLYRLWPLLFVAR